MLTCVLLMAPAVRDAMLAHALVEVPLEACGMLSAPVHGAIVDAFHPITNAAESATIFELDGQEMIDLERRIDRAGRALVAVMHSHPQTSPYPSPTDIAAIARFDPSGVFHHVIVSLRHAEPGLRSFGISEGRVVEEFVDVADGAPDVGDGQGAVASVAQLERRR